MRKMFMIALAIITLLSVTDFAVAWSEGNCMLLCAKTASPERVQDCQTRNGGCGRFAGGKHEPMSVIERRTAAWKARSRARNYLAGSIYEGKMSGGRTFRNPRGSCGALVHSAGYC